MVIITLNFQLSILNYISLNSQLIFRFVGQMPSRKI